MAQLVSLPGRLDWTVWHGQEEQAILTWPSGALTGTGPWTAEVTVSGEAPIVAPVVIAGDVMTITLPAGATSGLTYRIGLLVVTDDDRDRVAGTVRVTDSPGPSVMEATVVLSEGEVVDVTVPPAPVPATPPSIELDVAEIEDGPDPSFSTGGLLGLVPVPGMVVTVPDVARPVYIHCEALVNHSGAPANVGVAIAAPGSGALGDQVAIGPAYVAADSPTSLMSSDCWHRLDPNSPGDWQMFLWAGTAGDITLRVDDAGTPRIRAMQA